MKFNESLEQLQQLHAALATRSYNGEAIDGEIASNIITQINALELYIESEIVHSTLRMYYGREFGKNLSDNSDGYIATHIEDKDGKFYDYGEIVVDGTNIEKSILDDKYIYVPYETGLLFVEVKRGNVTIRIKMNGNNYITEDDDIVHGLGQCYFIIEDEEDENNPLSVTSITFAADEIKGNYIYPMQNKDGSYSISIAEV